ncbi:hypothetical protein EPI10_024263 [Gossypium australe]|uniref:Uncharacterized protein n=1 Tax=Gossypium australe TaxID=47621 RepID=A0A5B6VY50_9ROSI|nr:hypothetical protein EPI10_024263 [Gossypium australe]
MEVGFDAPFKAASPGAPKPERSLPALGFGSTSTTERGFRRCASGVQVQLEGGGRDMGGAAGVAVVAVVRGRDDNS